MAEIRSETLRVSVSPVHGGMVTQIYAEGREVLKLDTGALGMTPMSAGGNPILFPFPSKTANDTYMLDGKKYAMPFHGLVKNAAFAVREQTENKIVLWRDGCRAEKEANYPFDYELELEYRVEGDTLHTLARITNLSEKPMPHCIGWHPFFKTSDKHKLTFRYDMKKNYDYVNCVDLDAPETLDLSLNWDHVFFGSDSGSFEFENPVDGYRVRCQMDENHEVMVVCSFLEGTVCLEPWCGIPDSANNGRFLRWIGAGARRTYAVSWQIGKL